MTTTITTSSADETLNLGKRVGETLRGGEVIELKSDLGGGKTTFVKGIALGMGSEDTVQSPTFTISLQYQCPEGRELHHYDFYRLHDPGVVAAQLDESLHREDVVTVIEWSDVVAHVLSEPAIVVTINVGVGEDDRDFTFNIPSKYGYIADALL
jgi:tRNA threonylcarbamoyladenosine biosynthesis protein TsaE